MLRLILFIFFSLLKASWRLLSLSLLWVFKETIVFAEVSLWSPQVPAWISRLGSGHAVPEHCVSAEPAERTRRMETPSKPAGQPQRRTTAGLTAASFQWKHAGVRSHAHRKLCFVFQGYGLPPPSQRYNWNWTLSLMWKKASYFLFHANIVFFGLLICNGFFLVLLTKCSYVLIFKNMPVKLMKYT